MKLRSLRSTKNTKYPEDADRLQELVRDAYRAMRRLDYAVRSGARPARVLVITEEAMRKLQRARARGVMMLDDAA